MLELYGILIVWSNRFGTFQMSFVFCVCYVVEINFHYDLMDLSLKASINGMSYTTVDLKDSSWRMKITYSPIQWSFIVSGQVIHNVINVFILDFWL